MQNLDLMLDEDHMITVQELIDDLELYDRNQKILVAYRILENSIEQEGLKIWPSVDPSKLKSCATDARDDHPIGNMGKSRTNMGRLNRSKKRHETKGRVICGPIYFYLQYTIPLRTMQEGPGFGGKLCI